MRLRRNAIHSHIDMTKAKTITTKGPTRTKRAKIENEISSEIRRVDAELIHVFREFSEPIARFGLFVVFFWFGLLKVLELSPASPLVRSLFEQTIPFMEYPSFMFLFGFYEMLIGIMFLLKGYEREVIPLLFVHMFTTFLPLFMLPSVTWISPFVPSLEGQYILKNLAIIAAAVGIAAHLHPLPRRKY